MASIKMDFKDNPELPMRISDHKSLHELEEEWESRRSSICKLWRAFEKENKYGLGRFEKEPGWCSEHFNFCEVGSPCAPWDPIPAGSPEGAKMGGHWRHHQKFLKVLDQYSIKTSWQFQTLKSVHQDMVKMSRSGMWPFTSYSLQPHQRSLPGDFSDISPEELRYRRYTTTKESYSEFEKTIAKDYEEMRISLSVYAKGTTINEPNVRVCVYANDILNFLNNPDGPWEHHYIGNIETPFKRENPQKLIISQGKSFRRDQEIKGILEDLLSSAVKGIDLRNLSSMNSDNGETSSEEGESDEDLRASESGGFDSEDEYEEGEEEVTKEKEKFLADLTCSFCTKIFASKKSRVQHENYEHRKLGGYKCRKYGGAGRGCGKKYSNETSLKYHMLKVHKEDMKCDTCGKVFSNFKEYQDHRRSERGKTDLKTEIKCPECSQTISRGNLRRHMAEVHNVPKYNPTIHRHIDTNNENSPGCAFCYKRFPRRGSLKRHMKEVHHYGQNSEKIICDNCGKSFTSQRTLNEHLKKIHSPFYKTFPCDQCEKHFKRKGDLQRHKREQHSEGEVHSCPVCKKVFGRKSTLLRHRKVCVILKNSGKLIKDGLKSGTVVKNVGK